MFGLKISSQSKLFGGCHPCSCASSDTLLWPIITTIPIVAHQSMSTQSQKFCPPSSWPPQSQRSLGLPVAAGKTERREFQHSWFYFIQPTHTCYDTSWLVKLFQQIMRPGYPRKWGTGWESLHHRARWVRER